MLAKAKLLNFQIILYHYQFRSADFLDRQIRYGLVCECVLLRKLQPMD